jgi:hypothetical protein
MSDFTAPSLINLFIENLEFAQDTEYVDLTEINKKYNLPSTYIYRGGFREGGPYTGADSAFVILGIFYCFRQNSEHLERPLEVALTPLPSFLLTLIKMWKSASVFKDTIVQRSRQLSFEWIKVTDSKESIHY